MKIITMKKLTILAFAILGLSPSLLKAQNNYVGQIMFVPYNFTPAGWHECDGSLMAIADNETLFTLLGTNFGGDGQTTFGLPNAKNKIIIGEGQGPGLSNYVLGQSGGQENVTLSTNQLPAHNHIVSASNNVGDTSSPAGSIPADTKVLDKEYSTSPANVTMIPTSTVGGNQPHNNMMPSTTLKCVISLYGIFPTQNKN